MGASHPTSVVERYLRRLMQPSVPSTRLFCGSPMAPPRLLLSPIHPAT
ncbi:unnamed protein product [Dibothriocephalus latus]|uniref:Uncharacterized protein n=1 Tax=Dibothriocephalus latus TaxID=60516 RepID=A0A3P7N755_DIBLA|nr:unnamed protein product [Dibothriocephalus latus]